MWTLDDDAFEEDTANAFRDAIADLRARCGTENEKHEGDEKEGMSRGIAKLVCNRRK